MRKGTTRADVRRTGVKYDQQKARYDLLPWLALECASVVLLHGSKKYDEHNWRKGLHWSRLVRAAIGHVAAFARGEDYDRETHLPHLAHAACCVLFLLEYFLISRESGEYNWADNRHKLSHHTMRYDGPDSFRDPDRNKRP